MTTPLESIHNAEKGVAIAQENLARAQAHLQDTIAHRAMLIVADVLNDLAHDMEVDVNGRLILSAERAQLLKGLASSDRLDGLPSEYARLYNNAARDLMRHIGILP